MTRFLFALVVACSLGCALHAHAQDVDVLRQQGIEARRGGRFADAVERLQAAANLRPDDADLRLELGLALIPLQRYDEAEKAFRRVLELAPDYIDARLGLARIALYHKHYDRARSEVQAVLAKRPGDADAKELAEKIERAVRLASASLPELIKEAKQHAHDADLQLRLGLALTRAKRYGEAERAFRRVLELAPDYLDARIGLARLAYYRKQYKKARGELGPVLAKRPNDKDAKELARLIERAMRAAEAPAKPPAKPEFAAPYWQLDVSGERSRLTGGRPPWTEGDFRLSYVPQAGTAVSGGAHVARRFDTVDAFYDGRFDHRFADWLSVYGYGGGTPTAHFLPRYSVGGGLAFTLDKPKGPIGATVLTFDGRYSKYVSGPVRTGTPGLQQYFLDGRVWVTGQWINTRDEINQYLQGYLLRMDVMLRDDLRVFFGYSDAPETSENITVETRSAFGGVVYDLNERVTLRAAFALEHRPNFYDRTVFSLGTSVKF